MPIKVPNFNTISALLDRLTVENIKLCHFELSLENDNISEERRADLISKVQAQKTMIDVLKEETAKCFSEALEAKRYDYVAERRTFE